MELKLEKLMEHVSKDTFLVPSHFQLAVFKANNLNSQEYQAVP